MKVKLVETYRATQTYDDYNGDDIYTYRDKIDWTELTDKELDLLRRWVQYQYVDKNKRYIIVIESDALIPFALKEILANFEKEQKEREEKERIQKQKKLEKEKNKAKKEKEKELKLFKELQKKFKDELHTT